MAKKPVIWTETALKQRREILKYWTLRNKSTLYAEKLLRLIREHINLIIENPEAGKLTSYPHTREAAMGNFSIYYKLTSDRKSTRLNSSHVKISYAVFCLKKKSRKIRAKHILRMPRSL